MASGNTIKNFPELKKFEDYSLEEYSSDKKRMIPASRIEHWQDFISFLSQNDLPEGFIYRGQADPSWNLTPSLFRINNTLDKGDVDKVLKDFRNTLREMNIKDADIYKEDRDLWFYGRHYGLPTAFLDWTKKPLQALFFAFSNAVDCEYSVIYMFDPTSFKNQVDILDSDNSCNREQAQSGCYTWTQPHESLESIICQYHKNVFKNFRKIYINRDDRKNCLDMLDQEHNVNVKTSYPQSTEAAAKYCRSKILLKLCGSGQLIGIEQEVQ